MTKPNLDRLAELIADAEGHLQNAKDWIKAAREGKASDLPFDWTEAVGEAAGSLDAALGEEG